MMDIQILTKKKVVQEEKQQRTLLDQCKQQVQKSAQVLINMSSLDFLKTKWWKQA